MNFKTVAFAAAFMAFGSNISAASPVFSLVKQNAADTFNGGGHETVKIRNRGSRSASAPSVRATVNAGGFRLNDGVSNIIAWCLDISHALSLPSSYIKTDTPFTNSYGLTGTQQANVEKLFQTNFSTLALDNDAQSAGFQLALWEVVYERGSSFDVTDGNFYASLPRSSASQVLTYANAFLGNLDAALSQGYDFTYYQSKFGNSQNLVSVTAVPLPAAGLMLGFGLTGLFYFGRRQKSEATA